MTELSEVAEVFHLSQFSQFSHLSKFLILIVATSARMGASTTTSLRADERLTIQKSSCQ
jgi:hypothetical protein